MRFTIKGALPGMNEVIASAKQHWSKYRVAKHGGMLLACAGIREAKKKKEPLGEGPYAFSFTHFTSDRRKDPDNIAGGAHKIIFDALQDEEVLENDGWKQVASIHDRFFVDKDNPRIEVEIVEVQ